MKLSTSNRCPFPTPPWRLGFRGKPTLRAAKEFHPVQTLAISSMLLLLLGGCSNFHIVEKCRFYRSGRLTENELRHTIDKYRLQTIIKLNRGLESYEFTRRVTREAGIDFFNIKLSAVRHPKRYQLLRLWNIYKTARYPILVHCGGGADRSGVASVVYVLQRTGDFEKAIQQLSFFPYRHIPWFGFGTLDETFAMYRPYHGRMSFPDWVCNVYSYPGMAEREKSDPPLPQIDIP